MIGLLVTRTNPAFRMDSEHTAAAEHRAGSRLHFASPPTAVLLYTLDFPEHLNVDL